MRTVSDNGRAIIKKFEGLVLHAYPDQVGIWTIGYGNTFYEDGTLVKKGDLITVKRAEELLILFTDTFAKKVDPLITSVINQNQFDAVISFTYNEGYGAFKVSTLRAKINENPNNPEIRNEFNKWNEAGRPRKVLPDLVLRRKLEADLYFKI